MRLLIHTQYFPPEVGAPQNRLYELAVRLQSLGMDVEVLTAMPNYPQMEIHEEYKGLKYHEEEIGGLKVHRSSIYVSQSRSILSRLRNYFSFVWTSYKASKRIKGEFDYVLCESPPLFLGMASWRIARKKKAKFIFNVSDLWPESAEKLGIVTNPVFLKMATILEESLYKRAALITGQTQGIVANIKSRFPSKEVYWLPNGVDIKLFDSKALDDNWRLENGFKKEDRLFLYAGILGHAQGLEVILKAANLLKANANIHFLLVGSGPEEEKLRDLNIELGLDNVHFLGLKPKSEMPRIIKSVDFSVIPLRRLELFKGAIPSKIFEILAMEKPIILGVEGEAKELFIDQGKAGLAFTPEDENDLASVITSIVDDPERIEELGKNGLEYVKVHFNRDLIAQKFYNKLKELHD